MAACGLFAVATAAGLEESRMNPSCVRAQVAQRFRDESALMAAAWNWWLGHAIASKTFTSSSSSSEEAFFIDHPLDLGSRYHGSVRGNLKHRETPR